MRIKLILAFVCTILIPTFLLAYFGLLAVRNEKSVIERNMRQKYRAMAGIVEGEIEEAFNNAPIEQLGDPQYLDALLLEQAAIFKDEVFVFDQEGHVVGDTAREFKEAVLSRPIANLPYSIAVYERYPLLLQTLEEKEQGYYWYVSLIVFSAISILGGGFLTFKALSREWRFAQLKSEFVSHLSHDLRRPLTSIRMFSEMLKDDHIPSEERKREYYNIISNESDRLTHLANNILDFSRIERGRIRFDFRYEDIAQLVTDTVQRFKHYMVEEPRLITLNINPAQGTTIPSGENDNFPAIKIDATAISQALMNLLTNAVKYSPPDKEIKVNLMKGKKEIVIEVIDQGAGIPKSEHKRIFQKFYRVSKKYVSEIEGSGLGLTLVKYTAEAHRGRVKVESEEGRGSKFSVILPIS